MTIRNITGSFIDLFGLVSDNTEEVTAPVVGTYTLTGINGLSTVNLLDFNPTAQIYKNFQLWKKIISGEIVVICNGTELSTPDSLEYFQTYGLQCAIDSGNINTTVGAEIYAENESGILNFTVLSQFEKYTEFEANGESRLCTPNQASNQIEIDLPGVYKVNCSISAEGTAGQKFQFEIHKNGLRNPNCSGRESFLGAPIRNVNVNGFIRCIAGDFLDLRIRCYTTAIASIKGIDANLNAFRIFK